MTDTNTNRTMPRSIAGMVWRDIFDRPYSVVHTSASCRNDHGGNYSTLEEARLAASILSDGEVFQRGTLNLLWERCRRYKAVTYAAAGSSLAARAGLDGQGAWCVTLGDEYIGDYATAELAVAAAAGRPHDWKPSMLQLTLGTLAVAMAGMQAASVGLPRAAWKGDGR